MISLPGFKAVPEFKDLPSGNIRSVLYQDTGSSVHKANRRKGTHHWSFQGSGPKSTLPTSLPSAPNNPSSEEGG